MLVKRLAAVAVMAVGVVFLATTFANDLFEVGPAFEELIDDYRPLLEEEALATAQADVAGLGAVDAEFSTAVVPAMAQALGMTPEELLGFMQENFPAVATGAAALPEIVPTFTGMLDTLETQRELFLSADAIPTTSLPATTVPWGILLAGLAAVGVGVYMFLRPGRTSAIVALGLAVLLVAVPLMLRLVPKSSDSDELNDNLAPIYTQQTVDGAVQALDVVGAMGFQLTGEMMPALAQQLGQTPEEFGQFIGSNFPSLAAATADLPSTIERFERFVGAFEANLDNYQTLRPVEFYRIIMTIIIGGIAIALIAGLAMFAGGGMRRKDGPQAPSEDRKLVGTSA